MKATTRVIKIFTFLIVVSLTIVFLSSNTTKHYDIFMNIFGGCLVGLISTIINYLQQRRENLELFYLEASRILQKLLKMKFPIVDLPKEDVFSFIYHYSFDNKDELEKDTENLFNFYKEKEIDYDEKCFMKKF